MLAGVCVPDDGGSGRIPDRPQPQDGVPQIVAEGIYYLLFIFGRYNPTDSYHITRSFTRAYQHSDPISLCLT